MNPYIFSVLFFASSTITLGWMVWLKRKDRIGVIYFLFSFFASVWGFSYATMVSKGISYSTGLFANRLCNTSAAYIGPTWFLFSLLYTNSQTRIKKIISVCFFISALIITCFFKSPLFISSIRHFYPLEYYPIAGPIFHFFTFLFFASVTSAFFQLLTYSPKRSASVNLLILATLIGFVGGGATFLPVYGIDFPQYNLFIMPLYPFIMAYAMTQQKLLDIEEVAQAAHQSKLEMMGILSASINHELRNPLYIIKNFAETLAIGTREGAYPDPDVLKTKLLDHMDRIVKQSNKAMKIIGRLTAFARKKPDQDFKMEPVALSELLADLDILIRCEIEFHKIEIVQEIPEDLPPVFADPAHLEEILLNLILNAYQVLKAYTPSSLPSPPDGEGIMNVSPLPVRQTALDESVLRRMGEGKGEGLEIQKEIKIQAALLGTAKGTEKTSLSVPFAGQKIQITIQDNGPGISPEDLPNIFKPFYTKKQEGLGLGLYITKQLIEKNRGTIQIKSKPGQGAAFIITFECAPVPAHQLPAAKSPAT